MKKTILKIGCLLFAIIMAMSTFVACNIGGDTEETQGQVTTSADENAPVPDKDWEGKTFDVLSVQNAYEPNFEIVGDLNGESVSPAVFARNDWIKQKYNVDIVQHGDSSTDSLEILQNQIEAGDSDYDLVFLVRNDMATAIVSGYMKDLGTVEYMDFSNDWYNQNTITSMKVSGKLFHAVSDFSLVDKARTNVLFVNRDLATDNNLPDILKLVREGNWTVEQMLLCEIATPNGDGTMDLNSQWGLVCGGKEACVAFWNGFENELVTVDDDSNWVINVANEHSIDSITEVRKLFAADKSFVGDTFGDYADAPNTFINGKAMFLSGSLSTIESIGAEATFSFTALPYPKFDTEQTRYYTTNDNTYCATFGIPVCAEDFNFSGYMIEVLSWKSHTTTFPEYYEVVCKVKKSYDNDCAEMLDLVFDSLVFDFGLVYGSGMKLKTGVLQESIYTTNDVTSLYNSKKTTAENKIKSVFAAVEAYE